MSSGGLGSTDTSTAMPPYVGTPLDCGIAVEVSVGDNRQAVDRLFVGGWPGYHTHWTRLPAMPPAPGGYDEAEK